MAMIGMPGCDGCEHFKEVKLDEKKGGKHPYRRYAEPKAHGFSRGMMRTVAK